MLALGHEESVGVNVFPALGRPAGNFNIVAEFVQSMIRDVEAN